MANTELIYTIVGHISYILIQSTCIGKINL